MLQLDDKRLIKDLYSQLYKALEQVAKNGVAYMIGELGLTSTSNKEYEEWKLDVISAIKHIGVAKANEICVEFGILKQSDIATLSKALALNYGVGAVLDKNNPYLQEYMNSEYYNKSRDGFKVYSRPGESYLDYDSGEMTMSKAEVRKELPFAKLHPIHFFENALTFVIPEMGRAVDDVIDNFDFSKYLIMK